VALAVHEFRHGGGPDSARVGVEVSDFEVFREVDRRLGLEPLVRTTVL
jgi:hypothetical protein